jgi:YVTN family beta-propeller protein
MHLRSTLGFIGVALAATVVSPGAQAPAPATPRYLLMVVSKQQPGMALYNAETDQLHCKSGNLGVAPHEGEFSPDGRMAYVPTYGSSAVGAPGTDEHQIHFIRTSDCQTVYTLDTGDFKRPHHVQVGKSGTIYVTAELKESILVIDPNTRQITGTIPTGSNTTHMIALSADERKIVTSNVMGRTLSILDVAGKRVEKSIPTETNNQRMVISPDQNHFVTNLGQERKVAFYKMADGTLDFTVDIDGSPFVSGYSADGRFVYVMGSAPGGPRGGGAGRGAGRGGPGAGAPGAGAPGAGAPGAGAAPAGAPQQPAAAPGGRQGGGRGPAAAPVPGGPVGGNLRAWKIDVASRAVVGSITENLGSGAGALAVSPVNGRVYITAMAHDLVSIIDPQSWTVVKTIAAEDNPDGMAFAQVR